MNNHIQNQLVWISDNYGPQIKKVKSDGITVKVHNQPYARQLFLFNG